MIESNEISFGTNGNNMPRRKKFLSDVQKGRVPETLWTYDEVGHTQEATREVIRILGASTKNFPFPKPSALVKRIVQITTRPDEIVLDSTAGSGTTGHSVMQLNKEDGGNRTFILIQQPYDTKENEKEKFNICEKVTAGRVRRVISGYSYQTQKGKTEKVEGLGGRFSYVQLGKALFGEYRDLGKKLPAYEELAKYIFYTEASRDFDKKALNAKTGKIGERGSTSYYLLYTPNNKEDQALDLAWLKLIEKSEKNRNLVVYCEKIWIHRDDLAKYQKETGRKVRSMLIPFNLK